MKTWVRKTLSVGVLAAGALLFAPGAAHADINQVSSGNMGALNGTQVAVPIHIPVDAGGVGVGILGVGNGIATFDGDRATESGDATQASSDNIGVLNGTQAYVPVHVPINVGGVGVGVVGVGNGVATFGDNETESRSMEDGDVTQASSDNIGVLNGTQVYVPINVPINLGGVGVGVLGVGNGIATFGDDETESHSQENGDITQASSDNLGALNGTQVAAPIDAPVCAGGVGVGALLGVGNGVITCDDDRNREGTAEDITQDTSDNIGLGNGTQVAAPIDAPVCAGGVGVGALLGVGNGVITCDDDATGGGSGGEDPDGYGEDSRRARQGASEAGPLDQVTSGLTNGLNVANLDLLGALG